MNEEIKNKLKQLLEAKALLVLVGILAITAIVVVSLLRERIVNPTQNQVSVVGQGKVSYQPDTATVTLGIQIDKASTADSALQQLNEKNARTMAALDGLGIKREDVQTQAFSLNPQYDYKDGVSTVAGYNANQKLTIKVVDIINNKDLLNQVVAVAGSAQANQVTGIEFSISNVNDLKQQARILAIADAKAKSGALAMAAGIKLGKVENWYENFLQAPDLQNSNAGFGGSDMLSSKAIATPQIPTGTQDIVVEMNLNYEVK
ncbi:MAG: SIMPL domain-containing protein [Candidatus Moraniibacteriota bacterium]